MGELLLYFNTLKYLKPSQIKYQILRRTIHKKKRLYQFECKTLRKYKLEARELDWDSEYIQRFSVEELLKNQITLLHEKAEWTPGIWKYPQFSHLWNFNLQYFEYGIALAVQYQKEKNPAFRNKFIEMTDDWIRTVNDGDGWHPYTISLRIPNWLIAFEIMQEKIPSHIIDSIYTQYRWLIRNQERHLLGNHYFENLKTIVICSHVFNESGIFDKYIVKVSNELMEQILADGVHFERSLMYHKIVLEDLIRITMLLEERKDPFFDKFLPIIKKMNTAMVSLEEGMGRTPHFNDAGNNVSKSAKQLSMFLKNRWNIIPKRKEEFPEAGYYKIHLPDGELLFDCGPLGPDYMCGHAHCDALSFELSVRNRPVFVNCGTYQYQGQKRSFFRSTKAHNTVVIDGKEQSELWGEHRAARRIHGLQCVYEENTVTGKYHTYSGNVHERTLDKVNENCIKVTDRITVSKKVQVSLYLHIAPEFWLIKNNGCIEVREKQNDALYLSIVFNRGEAIVHKEEGDCVYSSDFGKIEENETLEIKYWADTGTTENSLTIRIY